MLFSSSALVSFASLLGVVDQIPFCWEISMFLMLLLFMMKYCTDEEAKWDTGFEICWEQEDKLTYTSHLPKIGSHKLILAPISHLPMFFRDCQKSPGSHACHETVQWRNWAFAEACWILSTLKIWLSHRQVGNLQPLTADTPLISPSLLCCHQQWLYEQSHQASICMVWAH